jgi:hypothetical protein
MNVLPPDYVPVVIVDDRRRGCGCLSSLAWFVLAVIAMMIVAAMI